MHLQRRSETNIEWITHDPFNANSVFVIKENNATSPFQPLIPAAMQSLMDGLPPGAGGKYGMIPSQRGFDPLLVCVSASEDSILMVSPEQSFWHTNGQPQLNLREQLGAKFGPLSHPVNDEVK